MPNTSEFGTNTRYRPGRLISWVSRAPLPPIGSFVTWTMHVLAGAEHLLDAGRLALDLLVVGDLARVQHRVATAADVDEGCLHTRKDVLHASEVDVADHGSRAFAGDEVLDELALLHHGDLVAVAELGDEHDLVGDTLGTNDGLPATAARRSCPARPSTRPGGRGLGRGFALGVLGLGLRGPGLRGRGPAASPTATPASGGRGRLRPTSRSLGFGGGRFGRLRLRGCGLAPAPARRAAVRARGFLRGRLLLLLLWSGLRFSLRLGGRGPGGPGALSLIGGTASGRSRCGGTSPSAPTSAAAPPGFGGRSAFGRLCGRADFPHFFACQRSFLPPFGGRRGWLGCDSGRSETFTETRDTSHGNTSPASRPRSRRSGPVRLDGGRLPWPHGVHAPRAANGIDRGDYPTRIASRCDGSLEPG